jgi:hypothetical protein
MAADPRRFPGIFLVHVLLIVVLLAVACATVALREGSGRAAGASTVRLPDNLREATATEGQAGLGPLSAPPSRPMSLDDDLKATGYTVPENANVYAVRVVEGPEGRVYQQFQAGGGALASDFWPASSIKVLAALGALDFARSLGFTGAATISFDDGSPSRTLRSIYEPAIRDSSNYDYDLLVRIAGVDRLNEQFLTARHGFPVTALYRSYAGVELGESPAMVFEEGGRRAYVPARTATLEPECKTGNCSNLFEMTESVRRIVMNDSIPPDQRFDLDPADIRGLSAALQAAEGFFPKAAATALGPGARIWSRPGDAADRDCLDVTMIESRTHQRYLLAASVPHSSGGCDALTRLAEGVLELLSA